MSTMIRLHPSVTAEVGAGFYLEAEEVFFKEVGRWPRIGGFEIPQCLADLIRIMDASAAYERAENNKNKNGEMEGEEA